MGQTIAVNTQPVSGSEALRLQLENDGKFYRDFLNPNPEQAHERLLHTLQTNDCREIIAAVVDGNDLACVFALAGYRNHVDILEAFLNLGMNINVNDKSGWTALMNACRAGCEECVRLLLVHNANLEVQTNYGCTALMMASQGGNSKVVEMLLEENANPDIRSNDGMTALMYASSYSNKEVVQVLLNHGVDIDLKNKNGKTALDLTRNEEIKEIIRNHVPTGYVLK